MTIDLPTAIFGRFTLDALPLHEPIVVGTFAGVALLGGALVAALTYYKCWSYLWREWFTSVDGRAPPHSVLLCSVRDA